MKQKLSKIDVVYILGIFVSLIGYYFKTTTLLNGDFFYGLSLLITPNIGNLMIYLGLLIILVEFVITKHYMPFYAYLILNKNNRTTLYVITFSVISYILTWFILSPKLGFYLLLILLFGYIIYILMIKSSTYHVMSLCLLIIFTFKNMFLLSGSKYYDFTESAAFGFILLFYIGFLITIGVLLLKKGIKKNNTLPLKIVGVFFFMSSILQIIEDHIFKLDFFSSENNISNGNNPLLSFSHCPEGYGTQIVTEGDSFNILCVPLDTGIVTFQENGLFLLGIVYLGLVLLSFLLNSKKSVPTISNDEGISLKELKNVSNEDIEILGK